MSDSIEINASGNGIKGAVDTPSLYLEWSDAPWDSVIFGFPVLQIINIEVRGSDAAADFQQFKLARDDCGSKFVSTRLSHDRLRESMLLESNGFRFIEMLYRPELDGLQTREAFGGHGLTVSLS